VTFQSELCGANVRYSVATGRVSSKI